MVLVALDARKWGREDVTCGVERRQEDKKTILYKNLSTFDFDYITCYSINIYKFPNQL